MLGLVRVFTNKEGTTGLRATTTQAQQLAAINPDFVPVQPMPGYQIPDHTTDKGTKSLGDQESESSDKSKPTSPMLQHKMANPMQNLPKFFGDQHDKVDSPAHLEALDDYLRAYHLDIGKLPEEVDEYEGIGQDTLDEWKMIFEKF